MQNLKDQLREELQHSKTDRRAYLEAELMKLHEDRRRTLEKESEKDSLLRRELDRLSSASYSGNLTLKQRFVNLKLILYFLTGLT